MFLEQTTVIVQSHAAGYIQSIHFGESCCEAHQFVILYEDEAKPQGYIRMTFDDLDLPPGTLLQVYIKFVMS